MLVLHLFFAMIAGSKSKSRRIRMRLMNYISNIGYRGGIVVGNFAADLEKAGRAAGERLPRWIRELLEADDNLRATRRVEKHVRSVIKSVKAGERRRPDWLIPLDDVQLIPPVLAPHKIIALGFNYRSHAAEQSAFFKKQIAPPPEPVIFAKYSSALIGQNEPICLPPSDLTTQVDYECELVAVIGRTTYQVSEKAALSCIAGYTIMNDVSARDCQFRDRQWTRAKSFNTFAPCGPWIVTADELNRKFPLRLQTRLNGELVQDSTTDDMIFSAAHVIAYLSRAMTLWPGDMIATGTPAGVGYFRNPQRLLAPGDIVACSIDGIGVLTNNVVS